MRTFPSVNSNRIYLPFTTIFKHTIHRTSFAQTPNVNQYVQTYADESSVASRAERLERVTIWRRIFGVIQGLHDSSKTVRTCVRNTFARLTTFGLVYTSHVASYWTVTIIILDRIGSGRLSERCIFARPVCVIHSTQYTRSQTAVTNIFRMKNIYCTKGRNWKRAESP